MRSRDSIRNRATLLICGLLFAVVSVYTAAAYHQVRSASMQAAGERLQNVTQELASMLTGAARGVRQGLGEAAAHEAVSGYLRDGDESARSDVLAVIQEVGGSSAANAIGTELRDRSGRRLIATSGLPAASIDLVDDEMDREPGTSKAGVLPFRELNESLVYPVVGDVERDGSVIGYIVHWRRVAVGGGFGRMIQEMIGPDASLYLANSDGPLWDGFDTGAAPPTVEAASLHGAVSEHRLAGTESLVIGVPVPETPWTAIVALPKDVVLAGPRQVLRWMLLFGLLLLASAGALAWMLSGRLTRSIAVLADAAKAISTGDYSQRAAIGGGDEVGILARAFNTMADNVETTYGKLEEKVDQLAATESQNRETRERLEQLVASSRAILYKHRLVDGEITLEWISENVEWLLGYPVDEALRPGWWNERLHPEQDGVAEERTRRLRCNYVATQEYRFLHADGEYRWLRDEQRMLQTSSDGAEEVIGVFLDVTEHRNLLGAREAAEASNRAKSEFLSRMSHELRTPMNAILGFAQVLELEVEDPDARESVQQILSGGRHLLMLIDEVLDISRVETGSMALSVEPVPLAAAMADAVDLVSGLAAQRGVRIQVDGCEGSVLADGQRLQQVLLNLLSNAIKYNHEGGTVRSYCDQASGGRVRVCVADAGPGISAEKMERLFVPFERLDAETAGIEGTGLGLSLSRSVAHAMGGEVGASSTPGEGSVFWIELDGVETPVTEPAADFGIGRGIDIGSFSDSGARRILCIEDNLSNVRLVERIFGRRSEIRIIPAMQGRLGLQLAREHRPHLILLDVHLPDMSGREVLDALQNDPDLRAIPVIVISADATQNQIQRLRAAGARDYLTKPFDIERLVTVVQRMLDEPSEAEMASA